MRLFGRGLAVLCFLTGMSIAGSEDAYKVNDNLSLSGTLEFSIAEFLKARTSGGGGTTAPREPITVDHIWYGHTIATLNLLNEPLDYFKVRTSFEFRQYATMLPLTPGARRDADFGTNYWNGFFIREGQGIFSLLDDDAVSLDVAFGYMPYKYNPEVRNLGEFLFRSGTYPLFLFNEFDRPYARLTGLRVGTAYTSSLVTAKADLFGLIEHEMKPFNDISVAAVGGFDLLKTLNIGGGINFAHLIPVDSRFISLKERDNSYFYDSVMIIKVDTTDPANPWIDTSYRADTGYYTYQGIKLMARGSFDLLGLFQAFGITRGDESLVSQVFGPAGGKVYGEYAIIGLKNYPADFNNNPRGYTSVKERSPWMVGVNLPLWKILDVCAFEIERFPSHFPDNYWNPVIKAYPLPVDLESTIYDSTVYVPRWNWSLYMKKAVTDHFSLVGKVGRDHQRWEMHPAQYPYYDFEPAMVKPDEWGWHVAAVISF
ncbi:MAG: hypothetical protein JXA71_00550 [Chitinispirillaceae bacterium]|nr:hypothetical protein [Chitinispirillaceae bacterium]